MRPREIISASTAATRDAISKLTTWLSRSIWAEFCASPSNFLFWTKEYMCNKIVPLAAHTATVEHGGFVVTVPRILDLVTRQ
jgi:hypothetical protein